MPLSCLAAIQKLENIKALQQNFEIAVSRALGEIRDFEEADDLYKKLDSALVELKKNLTESLERFEYNKEQAREFRLKEVHLDAYPDAQKLVNMIQSGEIELKDEEDIQTFITTWREENPGLPVPFNFNFEKSDSPYLSALAKDDLFKMNGITITSYVPEWDNADMILMEDWVECDYDEVNATGMSVFETDYKSPLIDVDSLELGMRVGLTRKEIDNALWQGGFAYREKTDKHKQVLQKLGLNPKEFTVRLIRYEEYVRLANSQKFGKKEINTHFDGYYKEPAVTDFCGLKGDQFAVDHHAAGNLDYLSRNDSGEMLAFRLVIAREMK